MAGDYQVAFQAGATVQVVGDVTVQADVTGATVLIQIKDRFTDAVVETPLSGAFNFITGVSRTFTELNGGSILTTTAVAGSYYIYCSIAHAELESEFDQCQFFVCTLGTAPTIVLTGDTDHFDAAIVATAGTTQYVYYRPYRDQGAWTLRVGTAGAGSETLRVPATGTLLEGLYEVYVCSVDENGYSQPAWGFVWVEAGTSSLYKRILEGFASEIDAQFTWAVKVRRSYLAPPDLGNMDPSVDRCVWVTPFQSERLEVATNQADDEYYPVVVHIIHKVLPNDQSMALLKYREDIRRYFRSKRLVPVTEVINIESQASNIMGFDVNGILFLKSEILFYAFVRHTRRV